MESLDLAALEFLRKSLKKTPFPEVVGDAHLFALSRALLVLDKIIQDEKDKLNPPIKPVEAAPVISAPEEPKTKKEKKK